ncbi:hypothetical protein ABLB84_07260 [Xenorhabdus szentirmaii]
MNPRLKTNAASLLALFRFRAIRAADPKVRLKPDTAEANQPEASDTSG